jgi:RNA polymerase sigma-70 factor (ECF subfamily)
MAFGESFEGILTAAQEGAEWAWTTIYGEYGGPLTGYLTVRGAREPEDLVGDVFLQIARNVGSFTGTEANFRSWIFMVAHHRLIDERRRQARRPEDLVAHDDLAGIAGSQDAEQAALASLADESLRYLLEQLTPDQRDVVALRIIAGLSLEETAAATGKQVGAVTQLQRRGLASLRRILEPQPITP